MPPWPPPIPHEVGALSSAVCAVFSAVAALVLADSTAVVVAGLFVAAGNMVGSLLLGLAAFTDRKRKKRGRHA